MNGNNIPIMDKGQTVDLSKNAKQIQMYNLIMAEVEAMLSGKPEIASGFRVFFFGGAIRGGKTYLKLAVLVMLAKMFPRSRWHVIRESGTSLTSTTIPSMEKILRFSNVKWKRGAGDRYVEFPNGSRIFFWSEGYNQDKELNRFKGLETNGILFEQLEELQYETFQKGLERTGSWYVEPMPPAFVFATFNPTWGWLKEKVYDKAMMQELPDGWVYVNALPDDNPFVTEDQWKSWDMLDEEFRNMFIKGIWDIKLEGIFFHAFSRGEMVKQMEIPDDADIFLSFDFNVDPMTCTLWATDRITYAHAFKEYRIPNSDTYELCRQITEDFHYLLDYCYVTGDASGRNRMAGTKGAVNHYQIINTELALNMNQFMVPNANPEITDSRVFCNSLIQGIEFTVDPSCKYLIRDLQFTEIIRNNKGKVEIKKNGANKYAGCDNTEMTHLSDTARYFMHVAFHDWLQIPKS